MAKHCIEVKETISYIYEIVIAGPNNTDTARQAIRSANWEHNYGRKAEPRSSSKTRWICAITNSKERNG